MSTPKTITGRTVLMWILAFFGVIILVNGIFVYFALNSWPGLTTDKAYEEGRDYNQTLSNAADQQSLGWRSRIEISADGEYPVFRVTFTDNDGQPLSGLKIQASFQRPVGDEQVTTALLSEVEKGEYETRLNFALVGRWYITLEAGTGDDVNYQMRHEINVEP